MTLLSASALYLLILGWASWGYVRRRDPLLRDVMLIFATVAILVVLGVLRLWLEQPPKPLVAAFVVLLLGQPFCTLLLVSRLRRVPDWLLPLAVLGWISGSLPCLLLEQPFPRWVLLPILGLFLLMEAAAAGLLGSEARQRGGTARIRLWLAAAGTALFGIALLAVAGGAAVAVVPPWIIIVSALIYLLAFLPPRWLRRLWSSRASYRVMQRLLAAPTDETADQTWRRYVTEAGAVLGVDDVAALLPQPGGTVRLIARTVIAPGHYRIDAHDVEQLLALRTTIDTRSARADPPPVALVLARTTGYPFLTAAPLPVSDRRGALVLLGRYRTLFTEDDMAFFAELAGHAGALAERADLLAERQRLAQIVESAHDAIIGQTRLGVITSWNSGARRLYGYDAAEAVGRHAAILLPPGQEQAEAELMAHVARGHGIDQHQVARRRKDGSTVTVSLNLSPITDARGHVVGVATISRDISEPQRAEAMFRGLLEGAPDAIVGVAEDGCIALVNAEAERLFGYPREELLGQCVEILVPERVRADHPRHRERYFADPQRRPMGASQTLTAVRKDGTDFPAEISLSAMKTDQGTIVSAAIRDISERLEVQAERERLAAQAERDAVERRMQHARRLESLGLLAGGVAHDFNNILAVIATSAELINDTLDTMAPSPAELASARADLAQIGRATERANRLTKQLLAFGRREQTQAEILDISHIIGDVEHMLRRTLGEHIHLITQLESRPWPVRADPSQVEQILVNLAVNARDAMPTGGTLSIDTGNARLDQSDVADAPIKPGRYVRLRVSDTGGGMPPEVVERAFEPFYTTKPPGAGTGLGLATVYGIATAAGGHVRLYSEPGIGTTVSIVLPAALDSGDTGTDTTVTEPAAAGAVGVSGAGAAAVSGSAAAREASPRGTILLVEDEEALRGATTRILTRAGYRVLAGVGLEAVQLAKRHPGPIHLLLTDVIMPELTGNEIAARIRAFRPGIPVLYMSGYAQPVLAENGTLPAGVAMIEKPFAGPILLDRIQSVLSQAPVVAHHNAQWPETVQRAEAAARTEATPRP